MMGVGKSTIGSILAEQTHRPFHDTDRMLVHRLGRPIPQLFQIYGESTFRDHETAILKTLEPGPQVISTGGGIVLREANWDLMRALGSIIYLHVPFEILVNRLAASRKRRPLLQVENVEERIQSILDAREPLYAKADLAVELGDMNAEQAATHLREILVPAP